MAGNFRKKKRKKPGTSTMNVVCTVSTLLISFAFPKFLQFHTHLNVIYYSKFPWPSFAQLLRTSQLMPDEQCDYHIAHQNRNLQSKKCH